MLDHLVYVVHDLPAAVAKFTAAGYPPSVGGHHTERGTYNALLRLGDMSYLELLAIDPHTEVPAPRWMGADLVQEPGITRWAVHAGAVSDRRPMMAGSRRLADGRTLRWQLTDPGVEPAIDLIPFTIDWSDSEAHPANDLPDLGLSVEHLLLWHPDPESVNARLSAMGLPQTAVRGAAPKIEAVLRGPKGKMQL